MEIPKFDPEREVLMIGTSDDVRYRVIPQPNRAKPTHEHTALRIMAAQERLRDLQTEAARLLPQEAGVVRVRFTLKPGATTPDTEMDWGGAKLPFEIVPILSPLASEVVHHLRTALEYLVYNMVWGDTGQQPREWVKVPCHKTEDGWRTKQRTKPLSQLSPSNLSALKAIQPFTGTDWLEQLTGLSNPDKHHSPILVVPGIEWGMPREMARDEWHQVVAERRLMVDMKDDRLDFLDAAEEILLGLVDLTNPLLIVEGQNPIKVTRTARPTMN